MRNRFVIGIIAVVAVFLAGFLPEYAKARRLDSELQRVAQDSRFAELRDQAGLVYFLASQKNYGLAGSAAARFFARAGELASQIHDANASKYVVFANLYSETQNHASVVVVPSTTTGCSIARSAC